MAPTSCLTLLPPTPRQPPPSSSTAPDSSDPSGGSSFDQQLTQARDRTSKPADDGPAKATKKSAKKEPGKQAAKAAGAAKPAKADPAKTATDPATDPDADNATAADPHAAEPAVTADLPQLAAGDDGVPDQTEAANTTDGDAQPGEASAAPKPSELPVAPTAPKGKKAKSVDRPTRVAVEAGDRPVDPHATAAVVTAREADPKPAVAAADAPTPDAEMAAASATDAAADPQGTVPTSPVNAGRGKRVGGSAKGRSVTAQQDEGGEAAAVAAAAATGAGPDDGSVDGVTPPDADGRPVAAGPVRSATAETMPMVGLLPTSAGDRRATAAAAASGGAGPATGADDPSFADANHPNITAAVHGQLLPSGGTMQIRLDPANLGTVQVTVHVRDGSVSASFETSNEDATRLLSHSLGELKSSLESTGITVDRMHVAQSPKSSSGDGAGTGGGDGGRSPVTDQQQEQARQEKQRRELMQKMWQRLSGGSDPLDLVA